MSAEIGTKLPLDDVQWRLYLVEDYSETESVIIIKVHHSMSDGLGLMLSLNAMTDKPEIRSFLALSRSFGFGYRLWQKIIAPYSTILMLHKMLTTTKENNGL
jgi:hypothetical protein